MGNPHSVSNCPIQSLATPRVPKALFLFSSELHTRTLSVGTLMAGGNEEMKSRSLATALCKLLLIQMSLKLRGSALGQRTPNKAMGTTWNSAPVQRAGIQLHAQGRPRVHEELNYPHTGMHTPTEKHGDLKETTYTSESSELESSWLCSAFHLLYRSMSSVK